MITILDAGPLMGYSENDHLIEADEIKDLIGRQFRSVGEALKATDARCYIGSYGGRAAHPHPYTWVEVRTASGEVQNHKSYGS